MSVFELSLPTSTIPRFSYNTLLDSKEYILSFAFLTRDVAAWYLTIKARDGSILLSNCKIVPNLDLLSQYVDTTLPSGNIILIPNADTFPASPEITLSNLSTDFKLYYVTED